MSGTLALLGGVGEVTEAIPEWPIFGEEERKALLECFDSGNWFQGERVEAFESRFAGLQGARFGVATTSGTTALEVALVAVGLKPGDEVILPSYTFMASAAAILKVNAVPIFCDVEEETFNMDLDSVERLITERTKALLPVHFAGLPADMDRVLNLARKHNLCVVEDAAHAWGTQWKDKGVGALGEAGGFSFQMSKNLTAGEGGICLTDNEDLYVRMKAFSNCNRGMDDPWYGKFLLGSNLRMTELQAAILCAMLDRLEGQMAVREKNAAILDEGLASVEGIHPVPRDSRCGRRSYHLYLARFDPEGFGGLSRERAFEALQAEGVPVYGGYTAPLYEMPLFQRKGEGRDFCPVACPHYGSMPDYASLCFPGVEKVCRQALWMRHSVLLGSEALMEQIVSGFRKVRENVGKLR